MGVRRAERSGTILPHRLTSLGPDATPPGGHRIRRLTGTGLGVRVIFSDEQGGLRCLRHGRCMTLAGASGSTTLHGGCSSTARSSATPPVSRSPASHRTRRFPMTLFPTRRTRRRAGVSPSGRSWSQSRDHRDQRLESV